MGTTIKVRGIIIGEMSMGEQDKRVTILTKEAGKLQTIAKGAKTSRGKLSGSTQLFYYGDFLLEKGRTFYYIREAQVIESFSSIRQDFCMVSYGAFMLEAAAVLSLDGQENQDLLLLLLRGLLSLKAEDQDARTVAMTFAFRSVSDNGFRPQVSHCDICGRAADARPAWSFITGRGAMVCPDCRVRNQEYCKAVSPPVARALEYIVTAPADRVYRFSILSEYRQELAEVVEEYVTTHTGQTFQSLIFLKNNLS